MAVDDFCIADSEDEGETSLGGLKFNLMGAQSIARASKSIEQTKEDETTIQPFSRIADQSSTSISSFGILATDTSVNMGTSQIASSYRDSPIHLRPQQPLELTAKKPRPKPRPAPRIPLSPPANKSAGIDALQRQAPLPMTDVAKPRPLPKRPRPKPAVIQSSRSPSPQLIQDLGMGPSSSSQHAGPSSSKEVPESPVPFRALSPLSDLEMVSSSKKRKRNRIIDLSDDEDFVQAIPSVKGKEKENMCPTVEPEKSIEQLAAKKRPGKKREKANKPTSQVATAALEDADEVNLSNPLDASPPSPSVKKSKARKQTTEKKKKGKKGSNEAAIDVIDNAAKPVEKDSTKDISISVSNAERPQQTKEQTSDRLPETSTPAKEAPKPDPKPDYARSVRTHSNAAAPETPGRPPTRVDDPLRKFRIPSRTKVSMTELLNRMGQRSPAGSPAMFKSSKRVLGRIAPLHPGRRTPPPPPPRVVRVEKKTKAQREQEELWEDEWEEQYGEAWYEMSEEDKERLRRQRRDQLWVED